MNSDIFIIWPNTLFEDIRIPNNITKILIIEHPLFFTMYNYHKMKLVLHRASMKFYQDWLATEFPSVSIKYIEFHKYAYFADKHSKNQFTFYDPHDHIIQKEYQNSMMNESPGFLMNTEDIEYYYKNHKTKNQRHVHFYNYHKDIILDEYPKLAKYLTRNYDEDNRNRFPDTYIEKIKDHEPDQYIQDAIKYVNKHFPHNPGSPNLIYSQVSFKSARKIFKDFVKNKLIHFGDYQDAVRSDVKFGYHSILSPLMNIGLITPKWVLSYLNKKLGSGYKAKKNNIEGYLRQIIGWREYCRYMYTYFRTQLKPNLGPGAFRKKAGTKIISRGASYRLWYEFDTSKISIDFLKVMLEKVRDTAYLHHIERLMYIGNLMLISEINPKEVFNWFQCMFLDSYHIFMYPNVYGMSQHTSGIMMSKMYLCSSNYISNMSDYEKNEHVDELYRQFIKRHKIRRV